MPDVISTVAILIVIGSLVLVAYAGMNKDGD